MAFAVSAVAAAIAAPTVASVLGAVAAVGAATSVVGIVTGKQNLVKIGGELGLIGGLGSMAATALGSGVASGATGALGGAATEAGTGEALGGLGADAFSDVAGEKFALSQGLDAAGHGFYDATAANGLSAAGNGMGALTSSVVQPTTTVTSGAGPIQTSANTVSLDESLAGAPGAGLAQPAADASAATASAPQTLSDSALNDAYSDVAGEKYAISQGMGASGNGFVQQSPIDKIKSALGEGWSKLTPQVQAEIVKSALAIPGGIQAQKNFNAQLDAQRQRTNQTSHGSEVPTFGIIAKGMKG